MHTRLKQTVKLIDRGYWLLLLLAAPFLWFPGPGRSLALLIIPLIPLTAWLARGELFPVTPLNGTILLLSVMVLVSLYASYDLAVSLPRLSGLLLALGAFFGAARAGREPGGWWLTFLIFVGISLGFAGLGLLGTRWIEKSALLGAVTARLPTVLTGLSGSQEGFHPNQVAGALLWALPALAALSLFFLLKGKEIGVWGRHKALTLGGLFIISATIFVGLVFLLTQSRSGFVGVGLAGLLIVALLLPRRLRWLLLIGLAVLIIVGGILFLQSEISMLEAGVGGSRELTSTKTVRFRLQLWPVALAGIRDFPLTGMGMNTFPQVARVLYPMSFVSPGFNIAHAHNEYLQAALDLGLAGLIAFLALHLGAFWMLDQVWAHSRAERGLSLPPIMVLGLGGGLAGHMIYGLTDAVVLGARQGILFWLLLGLICSLFRLAQTGRLEQWAGWPAALEKMRLLRSKKSGGRPKQSYLEERSG